MVRSMMVFGGSAIVIAWGLAHVVFPTRSVVDGIGPITPENKRILPMEWLMEGVLLVFLGVLVC